MELLRPTLAVVVLLAGLASARPLDPDSEAAKRHFRRGAALYEEGRYREAMTEFEMARELRPLPELDFNIGRCHERLEQWAPAVSSFERYLRTLPAGAEPELRERMMVLADRAEKQRVEQQRRIDEEARAARAAAPRTAADPGPPRPRPLRVAARWLVGAAVLVGAAGAAGYFSAYPDYLKLRDACAARGGCDPADPDYAATAPKIERAELAGYILWGLAGAIALVDIGLWIADAASDRRERSRRFSLRLAPAPGGAVLGGSF